MYFRVDHHRKLLNVENTFAHLKQVHVNGDLEFEFYYRISQRDAIKNEALVVNVSVFSKSIKRPSLLDNVHTSFVDTKKLVDNILTQVPDAKSVAKQQDELNIVTRRSDISSKINNEIVGQLRAQTPKKEIQQLYKTRLSLVSSNTIKEKAEVKPILHQLAHPFAPNVNNSFINTSQTSLMNDMIVRQGIDPSSIVGMTHRSMTSDNAVQGTTRKIKSEERNYDPTTVLLHSHLFHSEMDERPLTTNNVDDSTMVHVFVNDVIEDVDIPVTIIIPAIVRKLDGQENSHVFVKFELTASRTGIAIDTVIKPLDFARHLQFYYTPRIPPIVKVSKSEVSTKANLEIKQMDPGATAVRIYKKNVYKSVVEIDDYALVGTYNVRSNEQSLLVQVAMPRNSTTLYRVVPVGVQDTPGFEFTNVVINPSRFNPVKSLSLTSFISDIGINLEARNIPTSVVSIEFLVRNLSIFEKEHRIVNNEVFFIDDMIRTADHLSTIDRDVKQGNIYEYSVRLIYRSGTTALAGNSIQEYVKLISGKVDTRVDNFKIVPDLEPNVTFDMSTTIIDTNIDVVKSLLERQGMLDEFKNDITKERERLKDLIVHNVKRINLSTGHCDDYGIITNPSFSDNDLRKNQAIEPLKQGNKYRYEISVLLRSAETLFDSFEKEKVDVVTRKSYVFKPSKFLHPVALNRGVLTSPIGLRTRYAKDQMSYGTIGMTKSFDVTLNVDPAQITELSASRFDRSLVVITWKLMGNIDQIDHFLIMKEMYNVRTVIGKAHSEFLYGNCQFAHQLTSKDKGSLVYVIVPIFNDYKTGASAMTNEVII